MFKNKLPKISCFCPTFARPFLLEESLKSFLDQDYEGEKELIILNDCSDQTLIFDHPEVKIFNVNNRIEPIGKKFNDTAELCSGDILMPWDDDDIFLPWRFKTTLKYMRNGLFHVNKALFEDDYQRLIISENVFQCNLAISRKNWDKVGGYPNSNERALDVVLLDNIERIIGNPRVKIPYKDIFYIYRWSQTNSYHISVITTDEICDFVEETEKIVEKQKKNGLFVSGQIFLDPKYKYDYISSAKAALKRP